MNGFRQLNLANNLCSGNLQALVPLVTLPKMGNISPNCLRCLRRLNFSSRFFNNFETIRKLILLQSNLFRSKHSFKCRYKSPLAVASFRDSILQLLEVHLHIWRDTIEVRHKRRKCICILFASRCLWSYQWTFFSKIILCLLLSIWTWDTKTKYTFIVQKIWIRLKTSGFLLFYSAFLS